MNGRGLLETAGGRGDSVGSDRCFVRHGEGGWGWVGRWVESCGRRKVSGAICGEKGKWPSDAKEAGVQGRLAGCGRWRRRVPGRRHLVAHRTTGVEVSSRLGRLLSLTLPSFCSRPNQLTPNRGCVVCPAPLARVAVPGFAAGFGSDQGGAVERICKPECSGMGERGGRSGGLPRRFMRDALGSKLKVSETLG